ncbi:MAG: hypothetical protein LBQ47_01660 [Endomicrobium sp.]|jgi:hypothetical protein|nr:hypothetical protein [Endomicrobium sp.]
MKNLISILLRLAGLGCIGYAAFVIVKWYIYWISYYFIGSIKPSLIVGLLTFFLAPLAAIVDLAWHSMPQNTVDEGIMFLAFFIAGKIIFSIGEKLAPKY